MKKSIRSMKLENLTFNYGAEEIFGDVTYDIPLSRAVWVRAPGSKGKSTLLKLMAGLIMPQGGRFLINDESVGDMSFEEFLPYRLNMGFGFDMGGLLNNKTIFENLLLPLQYHKFMSHREATTWVDKTLDRFAMTPIKDLRPFAISGSQRKLTCVIRAFIHQPEVVLLDEPLIGLKQENINDLIEFVDEGFKERGLKQMFFTAENPVMAKHFQAEELLLSYDWFTSRAAAA